MTTAGYGITGLGYSPFGNVGLGSTGTYSSYDYCMPSTLGMTGMMPGIMPGMMPGMVPGMMPGMSTYDYWTPEGAANTQQRIETSQLTHAGQMHNTMMDIEVANQRRTDNALIEKLLTNGELHLAAQNIKMKINEGDLAGAVQMFDQLKGSVNARYSEQIAAMGDQINSNASVVSAIDYLYSSVNGTTLMDDIKKCDEGAFTNGFNQAFRPGHSKMTVNEALNHVYGTRIDNAGYEKNKEKVGKVVGHIAGGAEKGAIGAVAGVAGTAAVLGIGKILLPKLTKNLTWAGAFKSMKTMGKIGLVAGIACEIFWQCTKDKD